MKNNIHVERANYLLENNLTVQEAALLLNVNTSTIYKSLNMVSTTLKDKVNLMISLKKSKSKTGAKKKFLYETRAEQIINDPSIVSMKNACSKLNIKRRALEESMKLLKINNLALYNKLMLTLKGRKPKDIAVNKIIKYAIANSSTCTRQDAMKHVNCNNKEFNKYIEYMKINYPKKHREVCKIFKKNKNTCYRQYGNYMLENNCFFDEVAKHFGISSKTVRNSYYVALRMNDRDLYNSIKIMRIIRKNIKPTQNVKVK